ncbi:DUF4386 domain-containing protein [Oricola sp.]|uniref:DUF4386 domain-containing protein n=1 Tax=Oricola sp. TaxID=1979950 RepID=UPI0025DF1FE3|nr:DUF4386 domain-containing protein [Oricola sp.]MCI5075175.1 DUF4386 domain-containing protein [Oricola sp.]
MNALSPRTSALIAGTAYLAMTVTAISTLFDSEIVSALLESGSEAPAWPTDISSGILLQLIGLAAVAVLDVVVAWALYCLFQPKAPGIALWMAIARIVYVVVFAWAQTRIAAAWAITRADALDEGSIDAVLAALQDFQRSWDLAFFAFSVHLVLLGMLIWSESVLRKTIAALLVIAGVGYFIDSVIAFTMPDVTLRLGVYTFIGEMVLMIWLLTVAGRRETR